jgi:hypothetical protein
MIQDYYLLYYKAIIHLMFSGIMERYIYTRIEDKLCSMAFLSKVLRCEKRWWRGRGASRDDSLALKMTMSENGWPSLLC